MQYPTHITTYWIHLLVFSHAQRADRMEFEMGVNESEGSVCAQDGAKLQFYLIFQYYRAAVI